MKKRLVLLAVAIFLFNLSVYPDSAKSDHASRQSNSRQAEGPSRNKAPFKRGRSANQLYTIESIMHTLNYFPIEASGPWDCLPFTVEDVDNAVYPLHFDWRELGGVTAIDTQPDYGCGGCWVYAATAVFESLIKIRSGLEVDLSEEHISSCLRNGNHTGIAWQAFNFMQSNGVTTEEHIPCDFLFPVCDYEMNPDYYYLNDNWILGMYDLPLAERVRIMKYAIQNYGPVAGGFIVYEDWGDYRSGVYIHDDQSPYAGHHSIAIVGWADDASIPTGGYWIVKNDFGEEWGENGFFRIGYGECEIDMAIMFARWDPDTPYPVFSVKVGTRYYYTGESIQLDVSARVPEGNTPLYQAVGLPSGASYDQTTGLFTWTPAADQTGIHEIGFIAFYDTFETSQTGTIIIVPRH